MATTETTPTPAEQTTSELQVQPTAASTTSTTVDGLVTEKSTSRAYWKFFTVKDKKTGQEKQVLKIQSKAESANKANWEKLEKTGWTLLSENEAIRYTCKTEAAIEQLVPTAEQRIYLTQAGISYIMNSKINAFMVEIKEGTGTGPDNPPIPVHNGEELDLKAGINEKPGRRSLTQMEKLNKMLEAMGLSEAMRAEFLRNAAASYEAAKAAGAVPAEEPDTEDEDEEEEGEEVPA